MTEIEVIEHEETGQALEVRQPAGTLFRTDEPAEIVARATDTANALMTAVRAHDQGKAKEKKLISNISGKEYPKVECWTLLGTMLGVFPVVAWTREVDGGWEARVEAVTKDGSVVGAAEAMCVNTEQNWKGRPGNALRSMAQTRATSKALRGPLGFVMTLAGLESTPAEEIPREEATTTQTQAAPAAEPAETKPVTASQKQRIAIVRKEMEALGMTEEQYRGEMFRLYGVRSSTELTFEQANDLYGRLTEAKRLASAST